MSSLEQTAAVLYGEQKYPEALDIYLSLYKKNPKTEKYSLFCGNCFDALGNSTQAIRFYKKASKLNPASVSTLQALANVYYQKGDYDHSAKFSRQILKVDPHNVSALLNLGNIYYCQADYLAAFEFYEKAYHLNESSYIATINLANTAYDLKRYALSIDYAQKAMKLYPSSVDAYIICGNCYIELGKYVKAEGELLVARELNNRNAWVYNALSRLYQKLERWEEALGAGWKAIVCESDTQDDQHINFGYLLYEYIEEKKGPLAAKYAQKWMQKFLGNKTVVFMASAILNNQQLQKAEPEYVSKMFDAFAADFDTTLSELDYQAPKYIADKVQCYFSKHFWQRTRYLDLGCGTGLCAEKVLPLLGWSSIEGVDLSEKMLEQASAKKLYASLKLDEITHFLAAHSQSYHLITASDVLTYFGDLRTVIELMSNVLSQGGLMVFTISENWLGNEDYRLLPSGRFVHNQGYVDKLLKKCGCRQLCAERRPLRTEGEHLVYGYVIAARKEFTVAK